MTFDLGSVQFRASSNVFEYLSPCCSHICHQSFDLGEGKETVCVACGISLSTLGPTHVALDGEVRDFILCWLKNDRPALEAELTSADFIDYLESLSLKEKWL